MRARILRWAAPAAFVVVALSGCQSLPGPGASTTVVGRGDPALDVPAVQAAVDQGGTVRLKGTFDFGERGTVRIARDVSVLGEADGAGKPLTVIRGGQATLRTVRPDAPGGAGPKVTIRQIHFDGAAWTPIQLAYTSGATISGNVVTRVKPAPFPPQPLSGGRSFTKQHAVIVGGYDAEPGRDLPYRADSATGRIEVSGNDIDLANDAPTSTLGLAIFIMHATGIDADVARNRIRNATRNAIEVIDNYRGADGTGRIVIRENEIETPTEGAPFPSPRTPNGLMVGYFADMMSAGDEKKAIAYSVLDNRVRVRGRSASSMGILSMADGTVVKGNQVVLEAPGAIGIVVSGSGNQVERNTIEGSGTMGVAVAPIGQALKASRNEFVGNDVTRLKAARGEFALMKGANANRITGSSGSVSDAGEGNQAVGLKAFAAPR